MSSDCRGGHGRGKSIQSVVSPNCSLISDPLRSKLIKIFFRADHDFADDEGGELVPDSFQLGDGAKIVHGKKNADKSQSSRVPCHQRLGRWNERRNDVLWEIRQRLDGASWPPSGGRM